MFIRGSFEAKNANASHMEILKGTWLATRNGLAAENSSQWDCTGNMYTNAVDFNGKHVDDLSIFTSVLHAFINAPA